MTYGNYVQQLIKFSFTTSTYLFFSFITSGAKNNIHANSNNDDSTK